jgi:hypothetical protein
MKKIKMSVAALLIAMNGYSQCNYQHNNSNNCVYQQSLTMFTTISHKADDVMDAIRMDMFYGKITQENGKYYLNEILAIKSKNEDLMNKVFVELNEHIVTEVYKYEGLYVNE